MKLTLEILTLLVFVVAMVISPVAWYRMVRAKNRVDYWKNIVLFAIPILLALFLAKNSGLMKEAPSTPPPGMPSAVEIFEKMPAEQILLIGLAALIWIGGGNFLFSMHNRRLGKKWWQALNPLEPPFKDFNSREWLILCALIASSMCVGVLAIALGRGA